MPIQQVSSVSDRLRLYHILSSSGWSLIVNVDLRAIPAPHYIHSYKLGVGSIQPFS